MMKKWREFCFIARDVFVIVACICMLLYWAFIDRVNAFFTGKIQRKEVSKDG